MGKYLRRAVALGALLLAAASPATAHENSSTYRSVVYQARPPQPGLRVEVLGGTRFLRLTNRTGRVVVVDGYQGEPYARLLPDGTVEINRRSPATYLNRDQLGATPVPPYASATARPQWRVLSHAGQLTWHDHRMHWMGSGIPPQVHDKARETKIFDYRIPVSVDGKAAAIRGALFWTGVQPLSRSAWMLPALTLVLVAAVAAVAGRRKRSEKRVRSERAREAW